MEDQITANFNYSEFIKTSYSDHKQANQDQCNEEIRHNIRKLCVEILQPVRDRFGPMVIRSGFRCPDLNQAVGGSKNSDHLYGLAADFTCDNLEEAFDFIRQNESLRFKQVILENKNGQKWIHISFHKARRQAKKAVWINDKMQYTDA
jgi:hypothetical protein